MGIIVEPFTESHRRYAKLGVPFDATPATRTPRLTRLSPDELEHRFVGVRPSAISGVAGLTVEIDDLVYTVEVLNPQGSGSMGTANAKPG